MRFSGAPNVDRSSLSLGPQRTGFSIEIPHVDGVRARVSHWISARGEHLLATLATMRDSRKVL